MQILKFLGRGSAFNIKEGNTSAYIKDNGTLLLIDCGESIFERIINKALLDDVNNIHVLITHLNSDHVGSLSSLIYYCYYVKQIKINTYFPTNELQLLLELNGNTLEQYNFKYIEKFYEYKANNNIIFSFIPTKHIEGINCYGLDIQYKNTFVYYSGDSNIANYNKTLLKSYDKIYQDTCLADYEGNVHLSLKKLCESVPIEFRNKIYCMHLDCNELINNAKKEGFNVVKSD